MATQLLSAAAALSDAQLIVQMKRLAGSEREATVRLVAHLAEFDARELYLGEGYPSLFKYCTQVLPLSEPAAYVRIRAARLVRQFPIVLEKLQSGALSLSALKTLAPVLTVENHRDLLAAAGFQSKEQVERLVATRCPQPDVPAVIRKLPAPRMVGVAGSDATIPSSRAAAEVAMQTSDLWTHPVTPDVVGSVSTHCAEPAPAPATVQLHAQEPATSRAIITPLSSDRYKIQITASSQMVDKLRRAQDLLRHQFPNGDPAAVFDRALTVLVAHLEKTQLAVTSRPRSQRPHKPGSRNVPAAVRRAVWERDAGRCAFVAADGHQCNEPGFLQFHHVAPHGDGGLPSPENIELRCRAHNLYEADLYFGPENKVVRSAATKKRAAKRRARKRRQRGLPPRQH